MGKSNPSLFYHRDRKLSALCHGDDFVAQGRRSDLMWLEKHLGSKFKTKSNHEADCENMPMKIRKYSQANIFQGGDDKEDPVDEPEAPLIYGDLRLDEDETAALLLDPKFAVLNTLNIEAL